MVKRKFNYAANGVVVLCTHIWCSWRLLVGRKTGLFPNCHAVSDDGQKQIDFCSVNKTTRWKFKCRENLQLIPSFQNVNKRLGNLERNYFRMFSWEVLYDHYELTANTFWTKKYNRFDMILIYFSWITKHPQMSTWFIGALRLSI